MFSKIEVNGDNAAPLYKWLKSEKADDEGKQDIKWNFTKFLVSGAGKVLQRYGPQVTPEEISTSLGELL